MERGLAKLQKEFDLIEEDFIWTKLYQNIKNYCSKKDCTVLEAKKPLNKNLNRYNDVSPFDHTRIILKRTEADYINASLVHMPEVNRAYILTQGPLERTVSHFWLMVWEQKSTAVIMLNRLLEKNQVKCSKYWPTLDEQQLTFTDVSLNLTISNEDVQPNFILRTFILLDFVTSEERTIKHFHYTAWPDFGVPESPKAFLKFLEIIKSGETFSDIGKPPVIHCSAGIGRSGTFCLVESCLVEFENTWKVEDIQQTLLKMRESRMGLIQTPDQLRFSYLAIIEGAKQIVASAIDNPFEDEENCALPINDKSKETSDSDEESDDYSSDSKIIDTDYESNNSEDQPFPPPLPAKLNGVKRKSDNVHVEDNFTNKRWLFSIGLIAIVFAYVVYKR